MEADSGIAVGGGGYEQVIQTHEFDPLSDDGLRYQRPGATRGPPVSASSADGPDRPPSPPAIADLVGLGGGVDAGGGGVRFDEDEDIAFGPGAGWASAVPKHYHSPEKCFPSVSQDAGRSNPAPPPGRCPPPQPAIVDLMGGFDDEPTAAAAPNVSSYAPAAASSSVHQDDDFGDDFFSGGTAVPPTASSSTPTGPTRPAAAGGASGARPGPARPPAANLISDLHGLDDVDVGSNQHLYEEDAGEWVSHCHHLKADICS